MNSTKPTTNTTAEVAAAGSSKTRAKNTRKRRVVPIKVATPPGPRRTTRGNGNRKISSSPQSAPTRPSEDPSYRAAPREKHFWGTQLKPCGDDMIEDDFLAMGMEAGKVKDLMGKREMMKVDGFAQPYVPGNGMAVEGTGLTGAEKRVKARVAAAKRKAAQKEKETVKQWDERWAQEMFGVNITGEIPSPSSGEPATASPEEPTTQSPESGEGKTSTETSPGRRVFPPRESKGKRKYAERDEPAAAKTAPKRRKVADPWTPIPEPAPTLEKPAKRKSSSGSEPAATQTATKRRKVAEQPTTSLPLPKIGTKGKRKSSSDYELTTTETATKRCRVAEPPATKAVDKSTPSTTATPRDSVLPAGPPVTDAAVKSTSTIDATPRDSATPAEPTSRRRSQRQQAKAATTNYSDALASSSPNSTSAMPGTGSDSITPPKATKSKINLKLKSSLASDPKDNAAATTAITAQSNWGSMPPPCETNVVKPAKPIKAPAKAAPAKRARRTVSDADRIRRAPKPKKTPETVMEDSDDEEDDAAADA